MSKTTNVILVFLGLLVLVGLLGFGGNSDVDIALNESANAGDVLHSSFEDETEEAIRIPPAPEPVMMGETVYQDEMWEKSAAQWADSITKDSEVLVSSMDVADLSETRSSAYKIQILSETALEDSQMYEVSPPMQYTKDEYEAGLEDYALAMGHIQSAMDALNNGYEDVFASQMELADSYVQSGMNHMQATYFIN